MDKAEVISKVKKFADLVNSEFPINKIILYGSYANDNWKDESDIDVAVVVDKIEGDFLSLESRLYKLRRNIDERIEPVLLEEEDDKSGFLENILKYGETLYSKY